MSQIDYKSKQGKVFTKTTFLDVNAISQIFVTPRDLTDSPASNQIVIPLSILFIGQFDTVAWGGVGANKFEIRYIGAPTGSSSYFFRSINAWNFTGDISYEILPNTNMNSISSGEWMVAGEPLTLFGSAANPVGGDSTAIIITTYIITTLPL